MCNCNPCCPITEVIEGADTIDDQGTTVASADTRRKDVIIQNIGSQPITVSTFVGTGYAQGGMLVYPTQVWRASQAIGTWFGDVWAIANAGQTVDILFSEER